MHSLSLRRPAALLVGVLLAAVTALAGGVTPRAEAVQLRDVMAVGNGQGGTVSFIDTATYENIGSMNLVPDLQERLDAMNVVERIGYEVVNNIQGYTKLVDDMAVSPDGTTIYVSRGALSDAVAFDIATKEMLWRRKTEGFKADHAALSPDGTKFVVSATTASHAEVIDTATGELVATFGTGAYPHANDYSPDGSVLYNSSIGITSLPKVLNGLKGSRAVTAVDPDTFEHVRTYEFDYGIRPAVFTRDNKTMYAQLSYLNGFVEYDLEAGRIKRTVELPLSDEAAAMSPDDYPQNSAHHGMAMNAAESKLCMAGTISDYVSVVSRPGLTTDGTVHYETGALPYWTQTGPNGNDCYVSLSEKNQISVIDYRTAKEVARIDVGHYPQRERPAKLTPEAVGSLDPSNG
ncbi:YncE family protein [Actinomadura sp. 7K507]|uniref:YncE family protein n=1 Tax=Actinomadura sp. 7K507 TaxID=2530365 RepID=UPI00104F4893|nr:YncE family protein [Actinomadura sp. 7K507]TDC96983.1 YncE family protein [Actinomadura sp. 7K507]